MVKLTHKFSRINRLKSWVFISLILLLAVILYSYKLDHRGLWIDEFASISDAQKLNFNRGRLLYYILLRGWMELGTSDVWLRSLAVIFAIGSVFLTYKLGCYLFNKSTGSIAALMLTLSPLFINHAQEVRYYTMSVFLGLAGTLALAYALENPTKRSFRLWWASMRWLAIMTTPLNGALLFPDLLLIAIKFRQERVNLLRFATAFLLIVVLCIPVAISIVDSSSAHKLNPPIPGLKDILRELRIFTAFSYPPPPPYLTKFLQVYIFSLLGLLGIALWPKKSSEKLLWVSTWTFLPVGIIFVFSHLFYSIWITRYLMLICPYLFLLLAVGFLKSWRKWRIIAIGIGIIYLIAVSSGLATYYSSARRYMGANDQYRHIVEIINNNDRPGDIIVWSIIHNVSLPLDHYYRGSATIYNKELILVKNPQRIDIENWFRTLPPIKSRLWLVYLGKENQLLREFLEENFVVKTYQKPGYSPVFLVEKTDKD
ncbi:MAG: glycosyltransferase family 39 protein [Xenococcaceae cyanobacterium]